MVNDRSLIDECVLKPCANTNTLAAALHGPILTNCRNVDTSNWLVINSVKGHKSDVQLASS